MRLPSTKTVRSVLWLGISMLTVAVYASRSTTLISLKPALFAAPQTTVIGHIEAMRQTEVSFDVPARIAVIHVTQGQVVSAGTPLVVLENAEITGQLESSRKRLQAAEAHLAGLHDPESSRRTLDQFTEQIRAATRDRDTSQERLRSFRVTDAEKMLEAAVRRAKEVLNLVQDGLATDAEYRQQLDRQEAARRDLESSQEHASRLQQELDQAESRLRLLQMQSTRDEVSPASAEADLADARSALAVAEQRAARLIVVAPHSGTVGELSVGAGDWLSAGQRILRLSELSQLSVTAPVTAAMASAIRIGQPVTVHLPGFPALNAHVQELVSRAESSEQSYAVRVPVPNPDPAKMWVGLEAELEFTH